MNLHDSSRQLGSIRALELACFRLLGERAPRLEPASFAVWAASASRAHAWRAALLEELLPVSAGLPGLEELTVLPGGALGEALARWLPESGDGFADDEYRDRRSDNGLRLVADVTGRLYPLLIGEYALHLDKCTSTADGAVIRAIGRATADLEAVQQEGAVLCARR